MRYRSRLSRRQEKQTKRALVFSILGIIATLFLLIKVGIPLLINFTLFVSSIGRTEDVAKKEDKSFIAPPVLSPLFSATNSARIEVSGKSDPSLRIFLFVNSEHVDDAEVKSDNAFVFSKVSLRSGTNTIKAKAMNNDKKESDFSNELTVVYKKDPPSLTVESPKDQQSFTKDESPITVSGKTDPGAKVTVNELWAIVDEFGNFSYNLRLTNGENSIKVIAIDEAGNKAELERKVTYAQ